MASEPPLILAFDTSAARCAAALVSGGRVLAARDEAMDRGQAERLLPMLEAMLAEAGVGWAALDGLAVCTGPGNFTGLRIAVAAVRGLALALGVPAVGVTAFEALAAPAGPSRGGDRRPQGDGVRAGVPRRRAGRRSRRPATHPSPVPEAALRVDCAAVGPDRGGAARGGAAAGAALPAAGRCDAAGGGAAAILDDA